MTWPLLNCCGCLSCQRWWTTCGVWLLVFSSYGCSWWCFSSCCQPCVVSLWVSPGSTSRSLSKSWRWWNEMFILMYFYGIAKVLYCWLLFYFSSRHVYWIIRKSVIWTIVLVIIQEYFLFTVGHSPDPEREAGAAECSGTAAKWWVHVNCGHIKWSTLQESGLTWCVNMKPNLESDNPNKKAE